MTAPDPALATEEQQRGDNLATRINTMSDSPAVYTLGLWRAAARDAYENAAAHTEQPTDTPH